MRSSRHHLHQTPLLGPPSWLRLSLEFWQGHHVFSSMVFCLQLFTRQNQGLVSPWLEVPIPSRAISCIDRS